MSHLALCNKELWCVGDFGVKPAVYLLVIRRIVIHKTALLSFFLAPTQFSIPVPPFAPSAGMMITFAVACMTRILGGTLVNDDSQYGNAVQ